MLDLIVFGVTGYAGGRILDHFGQATLVFEGGLFSKYKDSIRIGIAGRSRDKLNKLRQTVCPYVKEEDVFVVDVSNSESLVDMARRTKVVINCVGPYITYGESVIAACLQGKADYVDLSGETEWIRDMQDKYHTEAIKQGCLLVSACGWDSVPADTLFHFGINNRLTKEERRQHVVLQTLMYMGQRKRFFGPFGGMGAGTFKTIIQGWHTGTGIDVKIDPEPIKKGELRQLKASEPTVQYFRDLGLYGIRTELFSDSYIVRKSQASITGGAKPCRFEYGHYFGVPYGVIAYGIAFFLWIGPKLVRFKFIYRLLLRLMGSGDGPGKAARDNAMASLHAIIRVVDVIKGNVVKKVVVQAKTDYDPNDVTSVCILRCAILLAKAKDMLRVDRGYVTTATAFGDHLSAVVSPCVQLS